jgi:UDPglucose 6-dehydrogenase
MRELHGTIHGAPVVHMRIESAELAKVAYNVLVGMKLSVVNLLAQICAERDADVDEVTDALGLATQRILSPAYMRAGMGDGGSCHPRDLIAMSWLAREMGVSDLFSAVMEARQAHTEWIAEVASSAALTNALPIVILGKAYKAESNITTGSPAVLLQEFLPGSEAWDPYVDGERSVPSLRPSVFVIATMHAQFRNFPFPEGSVVVDPWGSIPLRDGVQLITPGRQSSLV